MGRYSASVTLPRIHGEAHARARVSQKCLKIKIANAALPQSHGFHNVISAKSLITLITTFNIMTVMRLWP